MKNAASVKIRKAIPRDVKSIKNLIDSYAKQNLLLPRSLSDLYENIRDFLVAEENGKIVGCVALHIVWEDLAEVRSLAVEKEKQHKNIGSKLLKAALKEAKKLGVGKVFTLTFVPGFFEKLGFTKISKHRLPQKIWKDCLNCAQFPDCEEEALIIKL